ncbi:MAG: SpoIID/LytB domain-containing protein [Bacillota bacterium]
MSKSIAVFTAVLVIILALTAAGSGVLAQSGTGVDNPPGEPANPTVRVGLRIDRTSVKAGSEGPFELTDLSTGQVVATLPSGELEFTPSTRTIKVATLPPPGNTPAVLGAFAGPLRLRMVAQPPGTTPPPGTPPPGTPPPGTPTPPTPPPAPVYLRIDGGPSYRGDLRIVVSPTGLLTAINDVSLESYLYGVVPREMPASWAPEALKAQAVAARSFALYQMSDGKYNGQGFDLLATQGSQVYGGADGEDPRSNAAVDATAGQVVTYNGRVADALFHASSGGHTENGEIVFGWPTPYLRGVPDFDQDYVYYNWTTDIPLADMQKTISDAGYTKGQLYSVSPSGTRGVSGRYTAIKLVGSFGVVEIKANDFRRLFSLRSTLYTLINQAERWEDTPFPLGADDPVVALGAAGVTTQVTTGSLTVLGADGRQAKPGSAVVLSRRLVPAAVRVEGHGWGHGLGLSQAGANALAAKKGYTYQQILQYYYQGVKVEVK